MCCEVRNGPLANMSQFALARLNSPICRMQGAPFGADIRFGSFAPISRCRRQLPPILEADGMVDVATLCGKGRAARRPFDRGQSD